MIEDAGAMWTRANLLTWDERAAVHFRDATGFYSIERLRKGEETLFPIEASEIGDVAGKRLAHLQCHIGVDTLSLARRGALVTGLDFSSVAVEAARKLAAETNLPAQFVQADVYDAASAMQGPYDIVYVTWGSLNWLPDIWRWARVVSDLLSPGGYLYLAEQHPSISIMKEIGGELVPCFGWRTSANRPVISDLQASYTGEKLRNSRMHEWEHPLSDVIGALLAAGLRLDFFHEHEALPWPRFQMMEPMDDHLYRLPDWYVPMPLAFSLRAVKHGKPIETR
jgi:2-polyprenyl-3-methyl-5-hydroxy-6-metoxy-1,4-benzoquinol methylase